MVPHVLELCHQLVTQLVVNDRHLEWRCLVGQKVAIVSALKVELQICRESKVFSLEHHKQKTDFTNKKIRDGPINCDKFLWLFKTTHRKHQTLLS